VPDESTQCRKARSLFRESRQPNDYITKEGQKINKYTPSENQDAKSGKKGKKVGIAYELDNGEIIYVPEE
jgi:hypothetical protein